MSSSLTLTAWNHHQQHRRPSCNNMSVTPILPCYKSLDSPSISLFSPLLWPLPPPPPTVSTVPNFSLKQPLSGSSITKCFLCSCEHFLISTCECVRVIIDLFFTQSYSNSGWLPFQQRASLSSKSKNSDFWVETETKSWLEKSGVELESSLETSSTSIYALVCFQTTFSWSLLLFFKVTSSSSWAAFIFALIVFSLYLTKALRFVKVAEDYSKPDNENGLEALIS